MRRNISDKYAEMEKQLVDAFIEAQSSLDTRRMKQYAGALQPFSYVCDNHQASYVLCRECLMVVYGAAFRECIMIGVRHGHLIVTFN